MASVPSVASAKINAIVGGYGERQKMNMKTKMHAAVLPVATVIATGALIAIPTAPSADAAAIAFGRAYVNSPGADTGSNYSLNGEYIRIKNGGTSKRSLTGWTVRDTSGHVYKFGTFYLAAGATVTLYTGKGTNSSTKRYWGSQYYIWNNSGDKAILRNASGSTVDTCSWGSVSSYINC